MWPPRRGSPFFCGGPRCPGTLVLIRDGGNGCGWVPNLELSGDTSERVRSIDAYYVLYLQVPEHAACGRYFVNLGASCEREAEVDQRIAVRETPG